MVRSKSNLIPASVIALSASLALACATPASAQPYGYGSYGAHSRTYGYPYSYDHRPSNGQYRNMRREREFREREFRRQNRNDAFIFVAGMIIGSIITDNHGNRRQYYRDYRSGDFYYYDFRTRTYQWDYNFDPRRSRY